MCVPPQVRDATIYDDDVTYLANAVSAASMGVAYSHTSADAVTTESKAETGSERCATIPSPTHQISLCTWS